MKNVEERLLQLPQIAQDDNLQATQALKYKIKQAAQEKRQRKAALRRAIPALACALVLMIGMGSWGLTQLGNPGTVDPIIDSGTLGGGPSLEGGLLTALDLPKGSITINQSNNPSYRSVWASASGANFPLVGVKGRYYRLMSNPTSIGSDMLGDALGTVDTYTSEPALADKQGICSNVVAQGDTVYAVKGMNGAVAAAYVNGTLRVFQRVSFGDSALMGGESLSDTLKASNVVALELSGVGTINDAATAKALIQTLTSNASFQRSGGSETGQSLLIQLSNGITLQMAVSGEKVIACGTWACPEFFEAFSNAIQ